MSSSSKNGQRLRVSTIGIRSLRDWRWFLLACIAGGVLIAADILTSLLLPDPDRWAYLITAAAYAFAAAIVVHHSLGKRGSLAVRWWTFTFTLATIALINAIAALPASPYTHRAGVILIALSFTASVFCLLVPNFASPVERFMHAGIALVFCILRMYITGSKNSVLHTSPRLFVFILFTFLIRFLLARLGQAGAEPAQRPFYRLATAYTVLELLPALLTNFVGQWWFTHVNEVQANLWAVWLTIAPVAFSVFALSGFERRHAHDHPRPPNTLIRDLLPMTLGVGVIVMASMLVRVIPLVAYPSLLLGIATLVFRTVSLHQQMQRNTADLAAHNRHLATLAHRDPLTGLGNRRLFESAIAEAVPSLEQQAKPLSLLVLDVDGFKGANDRRGHLHGDDCLVAIARVLAGIAEPRRAIVARLGGDEFALLLPGMGPDAALQLGAEICETVALLELQGDGRSLTVSAGVASIIDPRRPELFVHDADTAQYRAKKLGGNRAELFLNPS